MNRDFIMVEVIPLTSKMKSQIETHGNRMRVLSKTYRKISERNNNILLQSFNSTFRGTPWLGWVMVGVDCNLIEVKDE